MFLSEKFFREATDAQSSLCGTFFVPWVFESPETPRLIGVESWP